VLRDGACVCGVIDFGDLTAGDPATDLAVGFMCFAPRERATFFAASGADTATVERARGWALSIGVAVAASDDEAVAWFGRRAIVAAL
jgi:aminoglycoside phosphotransferase (APT) family kinase protein